MQAAESPWQKGIWNGEEVTEEHIDVTNLRVKEGIGLKALHEEIETSDHKAGNGARRVRLHTASFHLPQIHDATGPGPD